MGLLASKAKKSASSSSNNTIDNTGSDDTVTDVSTTKVFGVPLQLAVDRSDPTGNTHCPTVIINSVKFLNEKGLLEVGLYRIPGDKKVIMEYRTKFNKGEPIQFLEELESGKRRHEPADVAGLVLQFLRELPESLFGEKYHDKFMMHRVPKVCHYINCVLLYLFIIVLYRKLGNKLFIII
jgi:hypothetical protein